MVSPHRGLFIILMAACSAGLGCQSREERERTLTDQCKKEEPCKKQGLCTGSCSPEPCRCTAGTSSDCALSESCVSRGECTAKDGKCVIGSNEDCARTPACEASGFCTAKDGACVVASNSDCQRSQLCKDQQRCTAKNGACTDASQSPALLNPALADEAAPDKFKVKFATTKGDFIVEVQKSAATLGAERLYNLVKIGYYSNVAVYRADSSEVQFGIHGNPEVSAAWRDSMIRDDPPKQPNDRGYVGFVKAGPHSRWAPLWIHRKGDPILGQVGWAPVGRVVEGMQVVDALGTGAAAAPDPVKLTTMGQAYVKASFPEADYVKSAVLLP